MDRVFVRTVIGFEREYVVSNSGDIFSLPRKGAWVSRKLKPKINHNGYERVTLSKNGNRKHVFVHRVVAENFIENKSEKRTVNHKDGVKVNNNIENLEWATHSENAQHAVDNNLVYRARGEEMSKVLKEDDIYRILELRNDGITCGEISEIIGRPKSTIQSILNGRRWNHITNIKPL